MHQQFVNLISAKVGQTPSGEIVDMRKLDSGSAVLLPKSIFNLNILKKY